jgi:hypothetical protein
MVTIRKTSMFVLSPGALASMFRLPESGTPVIGPSWTFEVFPDPDNPDPVNKPEDGEEKEEEKVHEKAENGAKDKGGEKGEKGDEGEHDLLYADMLKSDKQRVKKGHPAKFGYLPMMTVSLVLCQTGRV